MKIVAPMIALFLVGFARSATVAGLPWTFLGPTPDPVTGVSNVSAGALFVTTSVGGFYRSDDDGATWRAVNVGLPSDPSIKFGPITADARDARIIFVGIWRSAATSFEGGLFRSADGGSTWTEADAGLEYGIPYALVSAFDGDGQGVLYSTVCVYTQSPPFPCSLHSFSSHDGGADWNELTNTPTNGVVLAARGQAVYASGADGLFESSNEGGEWTPINDGIGHCAVKALAIDPSDPSLLYAGTGEGSSQFDCGDLYKSVDAGVHWKSTGLGRDVFSVIADSSHIVVGSLHQGFFYPPGGVAESLDGGATWVDLAFPQPSGLALAFGTRHLSLFAGSEKGLYRTVLVPIQTFPRPEPAPRVHRSATP
jgi:photosystem II stability/assembly factor-like uncharacterized protein